jgi:predicted dehydrogenase
MDYINQPLVFKLRKALRYARLYGPGRTRIKIESYYHMRKRYRELPSLVANKPHKGDVGILGCGKFAYAQIAYYLKRHFGDVIRAAMDVDIDRAASLFEKYGLAYYTDDATKVITDPAITTIFVASNHASHADYAIQALEHGKTVHIEKPHVVSEAQLRRLCAAILKTDGRVALGFNRPHSEVARLIKQHLDSHDGPTMFNWFIAGHELDDNHWYLQPAEGGRILGNLCHWTDFVYQLMARSGRFPIEIRPTRAAEPDANVAVTYTFGDGSICAITFSAKGHTFEGVKERFAAHRGNVLLTMDDFQTLEINVLEQKIATRRRRRDHGHEAMIRASYLLGRDGGTGCTAEYVWETGQLFLKTKDALEQGVAITLDSYEHSEMRTVA